VYHLEAFSCRGLREWCGEKGQCMMFISVKKGGEKGKREGKGQVLGKRGECPCGGLFIYQWPRHLKTFPLEEGGGGEDPS